MDIKEKGYLQIFQILKNTSLKDFMVKNILFHKKYFQRTPRLKIIDFFKSICIGLPDKDLMKDLFANKY